MGWGRAGSGGTEYVLGSSIFFKLREYIFDGTGGTDGWDGRVGRVGRKDGRDIKSVLQFSSYFVGI